MLIPWILYLMEQCILAYTLPLSTNKQQVLAEIISCSHGNHCGRLSMSPNVSGHMVYYNCMVLQ